MVSVKSLFCERVSFFSVLRFSDCEYMCVRFVSEFVFVRIRFVSCERFCLYLQGV